jgi:antitoxin (DNA-binding transcriptional repressor) of toxin-antitoxin stability system
MRSMRAVGLKVLKNRLSEYVRIAAAGETVLVTDRERVVAELSPPREGRPSIPSDAILVDLVEKGWLTPATNDSDEPPPNRPVASLAELLSEIERDREDR